MARKIVIIFALLVQCARLLAGSPVAQEPDTLHGARAAQAAVSLDSVTIVGNAVTHYADRDVVYITRAMRKGVRNTAQMLGNIPGIDCNYADNSISYHGSDRVLVLVDSVEKPMDYIKELHHLRFSKVDVIPNPSGKYSSYDVVLNLHSKADYIGYEGNATAQGSLVPTDGNGHGKNLSGGYGAASFTYTRNRWNFVGRYSCTYQQGETTDMESTVTNHANGLRESYVDADKSKLYRIHNLYAAADCQLDKRHSLSLSYSFSTDATDDYARTGVERLWLSGGKRDTIVASMHDGVNSQRHTLGLHYRGQCGKWNYMYDFNYVNDGWDSDKAYVQSSGFGYGYFYRKHMDLVRTRSEVNRLFLGNKLYVSAGYNFTLKDYSQKDRTTGSVLGENKYLRNEFWTWMSYRLDDATDMNFTASAERIHAKSLNYEDRNWVYNLGGKFYHKWSKWLWMRLNYSTSITHPQLDQVTEHGYFTDSLSWRGGNPSLRSQVCHVGKVFLEFFSLFNIEAGYSFSGNLFSTITDVGEGVLPSGVYGRYVTYVPQNTSYRELWLNFYIRKRLKSLDLSANVRYRHLRASYLKYENSNGGLVGRLTASYYLARHKMAVQAIYDINNVYGVSAQGWSTQRLDYLFLYAMKEFLKRRMSLSLQYATPRLFGSGRNTSVTRSDAVESCQSVNVGKAMGHSLMLTLTYRFQGGQSVRRYNRSISEEK